MEWCIVFKDIDQKLAADLRINWNSCTLILSKCYFSLQFDQCSCLYLSNTMSVGITAILIVFQPELRSALEQLGRKNWVTDIFSTDSRQEELEYTARTLQEISRAAIEMGKVKTGALIVLQREVALGEYERTGIPIDALCLVPISFPISTLSLNGR